MTPQDSVTEGEGWCPIGVQCQVHCTPLMQANARAAADSPDGWAEDRWEERGCLVKESPCCGTAWGVDCLHCGISFALFAYILGRPIRSSLREPKK
ncbi:uncharacterized protein N7458_003752 [Penicillium daleae]|uniref:Uncharacterized protein n=1 Tax=Penicillium daleae TaxID=63821 RepID=A0AAD6C945_9EURO|nr:uncharacterized protein N7458_003752 [Penicillium daleae]KAJ5455488.1 hypothetical protein N7458_003752 [Penicillium daleae]